MPDMVLCVVSIMRCMFSIVVIIGPELGEHLRHQRIQLVHVHDEVVHGVGQSRLTPSKVSKMDRMDQQSGML